MRSEYFSIKTLFIILMMCNGHLQLNGQKQMDNFNYQWKKIEDFQKKGLTKSALTEVNSIYTLAKKSNNNPQIIKALLFRQSPLRG